ncbi:MAG: HEAT repeat domain-containing protein [Tildeniella nuda ZEHNDER 1965/U140]|jgi:hypothetical protein|nr:HEAT repeat domain-containing protein [Tildeniella nuda ZEHNDER 1965/U140]
MLEWLATIGAAELGKVVFEQVLKLGQAAAEDYVKDFFKGCLKGGMLAAKPEVARKAAAAAVQAFLLLVVDELEDQDIAKAEIRDRYDQPMVQFVKDETVKPILGSAFEKDCRAIDVAALATLWQRSTFKGQPFPTLPEGFDWAHIGNEYLRRVRRLVRETPELKALLETELLEDIARNTAQVSPGFDVAKYRESLQTSYGYLKLYTLDSTDRVDAIRLWQMFIEQTVREALPPMRYDLPLDLKRQLQEQGQLEADLSPESLEHYRREYFQQPSRKAFEAIAASPRAVILGDPGAGKSSLLQYLALEWVEGKTEMLPLLIELREYAIAHANGFLEFLHKGRGADWQFDQQQLHQYLLEHPTLVMFDGLDEVFDRATQSTVTDDIIRFAQQYPQAKVLVTSRIVGYSPERLQHAEFKHFTLQPLDTDEIHEFIDRWYTLALLNDPDKPRLVQRLKDAIANSKAIQNLADNPLLLTMMAILNRRQELPRDRADLYDQASRVLLYHWDVDHKRLQLPMDTIGRREKQELLRAIAYEMQAGEDGLKGNLISADRLTCILTDYLRDQGFNEPREKANKLIDQLRHRNFILCDRGADTYGFVHRTFLEYFCAVEIVNRFEKQRIITFEQLRDEVFGQHWQDEAWREVLQLICGMIDATFAGDLIKFLVTIKIDEAKFLDEDFKVNRGGIWNLLLATRCFGEVRSQSSLSSVSMQLLYALKHLIQEKPNFQLSRIGLKAVFSAIAEHYSYEPQVLPWLQDCFLNYNNQFEVKLEAASAIAKYYSEDPKTLTWLQDCMQRGKDQFIQASALSAIMEHYQNSQVISMLRDFVKQNNQAVSSNYEDSAAWLSSYLQQSPTAFVRSIAVEGIANFYRDDPQTLLWLQDLVQQADHPDVRGEAVRAIARHYRSDSQVILWLRNLVENDSPFLRVAAVGAIVENYGNDPQTMPWLQDLIRRNNHADVQWVAVAIGKNFSQLPGVFELLCYVAQNELSQQKALLSPSPRQEALEALLTQYSTHPKTLELLRDRAINDPDEQLREWAQQQLEQWEKQKK